MQAELVTYDAATGTELTSGISSLLSALGALTVGLTAAEKVTLQRVLDLLEADEEYASTNGAGTVRKLIRGTATELLAKNVTTSVLTNVNTTIAE